MKQSLLFFCLLVFLSCEKSTPEPEPEQPKNEVIINGNVFSTVDIGSQTWTSQGYRGGTGAGPYPDGSWSYTIDRMKEIVPPAGWRIPTKADVEKLFKFAGATNGWTPLQETYGEYLNVPKPVTVTDNGTQFKAGNDVAMKLMAGPWEFINASNSLGFNSVLLEGKQAEFWCTDDGLTTFLFYTNAEDKAVAVIKHLPDINKQGSKYLYKKAGIRFVKDK